MPQNIHPPTVIVVTAAYALEAGGGGVQRCTREYLAVLEAAGVNVRIVSYPIERRPMVRLRRFLFPRPYANLIPSGIAAEVQKVAAETGAQWILFNQTEAAPLAGSLIKLRAQGIRFGLLSHGTDSADFLHNVRIRSQRSAGHRPTSREALWLGRQLFAEMEHHLQLDLVLCLSETDRQLEQWLGGSVVHVLPRVVPATPLTWNPQTGRIGTVCTLNHGPNSEGLELFCRAVSAQPKHELRLRLVGRPPEAGRDLARRFDFVEYIGVLSDEELETEARTWCAFINPIFCYARGATTKLAVPIGWQIPIVTSRPGARGYVWDEALVPLLDQPADLARAALRLTDVETAKAAQPAVAALAARSPTTVAVAELVRTLLR